MAADQIQLSGLGSQRLKPG